MKIQQLDDDQLEFIRAICLDPSVDGKSREMMEDAMEQRIKWIKKMMKKGLRILVAYEKPKPIKINYKWVGKMLHSDLAINEQVPMGLLEYLPIELALEPLKGNKSLFINCMWILPPFWLKGVGKNLLETFIKQAKEIGGACVLAYKGDKWFGTTIKYMPSNFFKKFGFKEVDRDGSRILLYIDLGAHLPPKLIKPKIKGYNKKEKIKMDVLFNSQCPWSSYMINCIKKEFSNFTDVDIDFINTDDKNKIIELGISRGIIINGCPVLKRMASWEEIKSKLEKIREDGL